MRTLSKEQLQSLELLLVRCKSVRHLLPERRLCERVDRTYRARPGSRVHSSRSLTAQWLSTPSPVSDLPLRVRGAAHVVLALRSDVGSLLQKTDVSFLCNGHVLLRSAANGVSAREGIGIIYALCS